MLNNHLNTIRVSYVNVCLNDLLTMPQVTIMKVFRRLPTIGLRVIRVSEKQ